MTKVCAIKRLASYVFTDIQAGNFWNDSSYDKEIEALIKLEFIGKSELRKLRNTKI